jgi:hypothetical protein
MKPPATEKPLSFADDMMKAFLADQKDTTRRVVLGIDHAATIDAEPHYRGDDLDGVAWDFKEEKQPVAGIFRGERIAVKPPYQPGTRVWIRETWRVVAAQLGTRRVRVQFKADLAVTGWITIPDAVLFNSLYKQTDKEATRQGRLMNTWDVYAAPTRWRPGRYMPRCVAREFAVVESIYPEQVQEMNEHEAYREGFRNDGDDSAVDTFLAYFDGLNRHRGEAFTVAANPWVWVIRFTRERGTGE